MRASKPRKVAVHGAMTRQRRSRAGSAISSPIHKAFSSEPLSMPPIFRIVTVRQMCWPASANAFHSCSMCSLTAAMLVTNSETHAPKPASGQSKSSSDPTPPRALFCCREDGSSSGPSHGWDATAASQKTSSEPSKAQPLGSILPQSNKSPAESQVPEFTPNQYESDLLKK